MLDVASEETVEGLDLADILELVERDVGAIAATLLEFRRQVEQRVESRERLLDRLDAR